MAGETIATGLRGLYLDEDLWTSAHDRWFEEAAAELDDPEMREWSTKENYFDGVEEAMRRLHPDLAPNERMRKARERYRDCVLENLKERSDARHEEVIALMSELRHEHRIVLVSPDTSQALAQILEAAGLSGHFDEVIGSSDDERIDHLALHHEVIRKAGIPKVYIGGSTQERFEHWRRHHVPCILLSAESDEVEGVRTVQDADALKKALQDRLSGSKATAQ